MCGLFKFIRFMEWDTFACISTQTTSKDEACVIVTFSPLQMIPLVDEKKRGERKKVERKDRDDT